MDEARVTTRPEQDARRATSPERRAPEHGLLALQRSAGNAAVGALLGVQRQSLEPPTAAPPMPVTNDPMQGLETGDLTPAAPRPTLRMPSRDPAVTELQERLNQDGAQPPLEVDGSFGPLTRTAVMEFQRRHGLLVDGIVGPQTWGLLDELARAGIAGPHDVFAGTHAVSAEEAAAVGVHLAGEAPAPGTMSGAGDGGAYERQVMAALDALYAYRVDKVETPTSTMADAREIGRVGQRLVDDFYNDHITAGSRAPDLVSYHPGSYRMPIEDASTRPIDPGFARAWVAMDMEFNHSGGSAPTPTPGDISDDHEVDTRRPTDRAEVTRIADKYVTRHRTVVEQMIRSYPLETGTGTMFAQLGDPSFVGRQGRWDLLSGMMHEYLHNAAHPSFTEAAERMGGRARRVLIEGFCDYFRVQAWNALAPRFESDADLRRRVEGQYFTDEPDASVIVPHGTYDELADAQAIVSTLDRPPPGAGPIPLGSAGGEANARAAYFLGHVDLLGIGPTTGGDVPAGDLGTFDPSARDDDGVYTVPRGGETVGQIRERAGTGTIRDQAGVGWTDADHRFDAGTVLDVPGIRWHHAVQHDTRAQVANQHGLDLASLERANRWPAAPGDTPLAAGALVLVPAH